MSDVIRVSRGKLLCYRVFDVAEEISLDLAERLLQGSPGQRRLRLSREGSETLSFTSPPLSIQLGPQQLELPRTGQRLTAEASARLYDYGAVSFLFELPIAAGTELGALVPLCDELYDSPVLEVAARRLLEPLLPRISGAIEGPHGWAGVETYTITFVEELAGSAGAGDVRESPVLPRLILGEPGEKELSEEERRDVVAHAYSYFREDLAVIDWNSAFVLEPSGSRDVPDILEFATAQLLELRYYDDLLDAELGRVYEEFALAKRRRSRLFWNPYSRLARQVLKRLLELTEFTEKLENSLKVIGDFYLARVYRAAVRRFRIPSWQQSVNRKQSLVMQVYGLLKGELDIRRSMLLELAIVILIVLEIALALLKIV